MSTTYTTSGDGNSPASQPVGSAWSSAAPVVSPVTVSPNESAIASSQLSPGTGGPSPSPSPPSPSPPSPSPSPPSPSPPSPSPSPSPAFNNGKSGGTQAPSKQT